MPKQSHASYTLMCLASLVTTALHHKENAESSWIWMVCSVSNLLRFKALHLALRRKVFQLAALQIVMWCLIYALLQ